MQFIRRKFRGWNANITGKIRKTKKQLLNKIDELELIQEKKET
jgi:hypothetical protein